MFIDSLTQAEIEENPRRVTNIGLVDVSSLVFNSSLVMQKLTYFTFLAILGPCVRDLFKFSHRIFRLKSELLRSYCQS